MKISRELIKSLEFRPFSQTDYYGFCDVQSPIPLIAENDQYLMIIDGDYAELYKFDEFGSFDCVDQCDSIRDLSYKTEKQLRIEAEIAAMEASLAALRAELTA